MKQELKPQLKLRHKQNQRQEQSLRQEQQVHAVVVHNHQVEGRFCLIPIPEDKVRRARNLQYEVKRVRRDDPHLIWGQNFARLFGVEDEILRLML